MSVKEGRQDDEVVLDVSCKEVRKLNLYIYSRAYREWIDDLDRLRTCVTWSEEENMWHHAVSVVLLSESAIR